MTLPRRPIRILLLLLSVLTMESTLQAQAQPNVVILFADDLGYGDIGPFGHPTIDTPHLNRMAREGMTLTQFYAAASVCTPSRAALLTGRLPIRIGLAGPRRVFFPDSKGGLPAEEVTIAEALREMGYATAAIGKWHLGHLPEHLPTEHGFDRYYGVPYSNDMSRRQNDWEGAQGFPPIPLIRDKTIIEQPADQHTLTRRYTEEAQSFIRSNSDRPFFLYLPHTFPHVPLYASDAFQDASARGLYGDVVEEMDWSVGQILGTLREQGLAENTLVVFTSDNGPWLIMDERGGTAGLLRGGKGSTWEGGMRVPTIAWWPETIDAGTTSDAVASTMDLFSTALNLAGAPRPEDRVIDGDDLMPVFNNPEANGREYVFFYRGDELFAVRKGPWKAHFITQSGYAGDRQTHDPPLLYHLEHDPAERFNKAEEHPEVLTDIRSLVDSHRDNLTRRPVQFGNRFEEGARIPLETAPGVAADSSSAQD